MDNSIFGKVTGQQKFELFEESQDNFFFKVVPAKIVFKKDDDGNNDSLRIYEGVWKEPLIKGSKFIFDNNLKVPGIILWDF